MSTVSLTLDEIFDLAKKTLLANGCDDILCASGLGRDKNELIVDVLVSRPFG